MKFTLCQINECLKDISISLFLFLCAFSDIFFLANCDEGTLKRMQIKHTALTQAFNNGDTICILSILTYDQSLARFMGEEMSYEDKHNDENITLVYTVNNIH